MQAIRIEQHGGPEELKLVTIDTPIPAPDEVLVENKAIGVNFVDVQHRMGGFYPIGLPLIPGIEAAGAVAAVGADVAEFKVGDRVAYGGYMGGNYAEATVVPEERLVPVPDGLDFTLAAAALMTGMTARCLTNSAYAIQPGETALIHGAAGGVGLMLVQFAKLHGATVIGTVSSDAKARMAREAGADHIIRYDEVDFEEATLELTRGEGVHVVYDSVGRATFEKGFRVLRSRGMMVLYGLSSGSPPPFDVNTLSGLTGPPSKGSLFLTWAALSHYIVERRDLLWRASEVFSHLLDGSLKAVIGGEYPLAKAAETHRILEARQAAGKLLLIP